VTEVAGGGANIDIKPVAGTTFAGLITEDFPIYAQLKPGITNTAFATQSTNVSRVVWEVTGDGLYDFVIGVESDAVASLDNMRSSLNGLTSSDAVTTYAGVNSWSSVTSDSSFVDVAILAHTAQASDVDSVSVSAAFTSSLALTYASIRPMTNSAMTSASPNATATVKVWIDQSGGTNGVLDAGEWYTTQTIIFYGSDNIGATVTATGIETHGKFVTLSATVGTLNTRNLGGVYYLWGIGEPTSANTFNSASSSVSSAVFKTDNGTQIFEQGGVITGSADLGAGLPEGKSYSFAVYYSTDSTVAIANDYLLGAWTTITTAGGGASGIRLRMDNDGANVTGSSGVAKTIRHNQTYTVWAGATTNSGNTSVSGTAISVVIGGPNLSFGVKEIKVGSGDWTTSYPTAVAVTTGANGYGAVTIQTRGFTGTDALTFDASSGGLTAATVTATGANNAYRVHNDYALLQTTAGTSVAVSYQIRDQWNVLSTADHQLVVTKGGSGFSYTQTVSTVAVSGGKATFTFVPEAATTTGSATIAAVGYVKDTNGSYVTTGVTNDSNVTVNVSNVANAFSTGLAGSYSSSVSYFPSTLSWATVTAKAANTGSSVTVTGTGVVFRDSLGNTASGVMTVRVDGNLNYTFEATAELTGTYTLTLTTGAVSTTSLLIVDQPGSDEGVSITWDTTTIKAGTTKIVTGKLVDANGNAVYTDNVGKVDTDKTTASILVTYAGTAGILVGTIPTETDADGEFKVSILTSALDSGTFTLTAVYSKDGSVTATEDKVTSVQSITVGSGTSASSDQKVNAGSFKGYVAVYAKGYAGQRMSAKIGNDWVVVESLASNFERVVDFTGAGYTIAVRIYIDRVLVDTITVTTK